MYASTRLLYVDMKWYVIHQVEDDIYDDVIIENVERKFGRTIYPSKIKRLWDKYQANHDVVNTWHDGRPQLFNTKETTKIVSAVRRKMTLTAVDVTNNGYLNIHEASERTMQCLLKEQGLVSSTSVLRYIKPINKRKRVAFAEVYLNKPQTFWNNILFSDECDLFPKKCGKRRIRKYKREEVDVYPCPDYKWDSRTVKVWGVIGSDEVGPLIRNDGTINAVRYIEILEGYLITCYPQR